MSSRSWFAEALLPWYAEHHRQLPWRSTRDPYRIWLSEVILQQTRVAQGTAYYERFLRAFPSIHALALATEDEVLKLWQGLGYYSRARNLRTAAQQVVQEHNGHFPADHDALLGLKGVGEYTAAAIGSIAFDLPHAVVDGNVHRVLSRVFGITTPIDSMAGRKEFADVAARLLPGSDPGTFNQAVMELGALVCTPRNPQCDACPLSDRCIARKEDRISALPVKAGRTKVRERHFNYLHIRAGDHTFLRRRTGGDIWEGLYELPLLETQVALTQRTILRALATWSGIPKWELLAADGPVTHLLSHQRLLARFWAVRPPKNFGIPEEWIQVRDRDLHKYAVPRLLDRYLNATGTGLFAP